MPASSVTSRASGSLAARNSSPSSRTSSPRRGAGTVRHSRNAACARSQAAATSPASATRSDAAAVDRRIADQVAARRSTPSSRRIAAVSSAGLIVPIPSLWPLPRPRRRSSRRAWRSTGGRDASARHRRRRRDSGTTATPACSTASCGERLVVERDARRSEIDDQEIGRGARQHRIARRLQPRASSGPAPAQTAAASAPASRRPRSSPNATAACRLGAVAEGQELVRPRRQRRQFRRGGDPADLPPGQREDLPRRAAS